MWINNNNAPITGKESGFPLELNNWVKTDYVRLYVLLLISSLHIFIKKTIFTEDVIDHGYLSTL